MSAHTLTATMIPTSANTTVSLPVLDPWQLRHKSGFELAGDKDSNLVNQGQILQSYTPSEAAKHWGVGLRLTLQGTGLCTIEKPPYSGDLIQ